jgi:hypothetical protein
VAECLRLRGPGHSLRLRGLESVLWPVALTCPHCGWINAKHYYLRKTRIGLRKCCEKDCRGQSTVRVGTVFESAHISQSWRRRLAGPSSKPGRAEATGWNDL